jgi:murein DD-endopeptidase MepM/ murein hydrolase activator NlpD
VAESGAAAGEPPEREGAGAVPTSSGGTGGQPSPGEAPSGGDQNGGADKPPSGGAPGGTDPLGHARVLLMNVTPRAIFMYGVEPASIEFEVAGFAGTLDLSVEVVSQRTREVVRRLPVEDVQANVPATVSWNGRTEDGGAKAGVYRFQVHGKAEKLDSNSAEGVRTVGFHKYKFPVRGPHQYGDGIGAGRGHRGQDLFAHCGTPLEAVRAGKVQFKGFQVSGAGNYVVIDGKRTGKDFVYMHLAQGAEVQEGQRVRTGQRIGEVGETGNASGCHLHFELWSAPGWYEGGDFLSPTSALKRWDKYS